MYTESKQLKDGTVEPIPQVFKLLFGKIEPCFEGDKVRYGGNKLVTGPGHPPAQVPSHLAHESRKKKKSCRTAVTFVPRFKRISQKKTHSLFNKRQRESASEVQ